MMIGADITISGAMNGVECTVNQYDNMVQQGGLVSDIQWLNIVEMN